MKILFFDEAVGEMADHFNNRIIARLKTLGHEVRKHYSPENEELVRSRHFQMYEKLFIDLEIGGDDLLFHNNFIAVPEYFLSELKAHPKMQSKIVFFFQFREMNRSYARTLIMKELIEDPRVHKAIGISMIGKELIIPENMIKSSMYHFNHKIKVIHEIITEPHKNFINKIQRPHKKFTIGYFGRRTDAKGVKTLIDSLRYLEKDIKIIFNIPEFDFRKAKVNFENCSRKIEVDANFYPIGQLSNFTDKIDLIVCPHMKSYEYGESGMPQVAISAKIPIIAPDFYFFNEIIKRYKIGILYKPEDPVSLGISINYAKHKYDEIMKNASFYEAIKDYIEVEEYAEIATGDFK